MNEFTLKKALLGLKEAIVDPISEDFRKGTDYFEAAHPAAYAVAKALPVSGQAIGAAELVGGKPEGAITMLPAIGPTYRIGSQIPRTISQATRTNGKKAQTLQGLRQAVGADNTADIGEGFYEQTAKSYP